MTATLTPTAPATPRRPADVVTGGQLRRWVQDSWIMTRRNLVHISREPMQLSDVTVQPVLFTVLFVYIFGAAMVLPGGANVKDFLLPGLLALNLTTSSVGTAIGLTQDLHTGVIERFRTLPMSPASVLTGRSASDFLSAAICTAFVLLTGLLVGWSPSTDALHVAAGIGVALLFSYSLSWVCACLGLRSGDPESAQALAFLFVFPLAFVSNAFAPTQAMPTVLEDKGYALALHYRLAPDLEALALAEIESALAMLATHELQRGKFVFEIRPSGHSKGSAIDAFMQESPFRGRRPLFIGDDVTDESGFKAVNRLGGISIRVGEAANTCARHALRDVTHVIDWLEERIADSH